MKAKRIILCVAVGLFCYTEKAYLYPFKRGRRREGRTDTAAFWDGKGKR